MCRKVISQWMKNIIIRRTHELEDSLCWCVIYSLQIQLSTLVAAMSAVQKDSVLKEFWEKFIFTWCLCLVKILLTIRREVLGSQKGFSTHYHNLHKHIKCIIFFLFEVENRVSLANWSRVKSQRSKRTLQVPGVSGRTQLIICDFSAS